MKKFLHKLLLPAIAVIIVASSIFFGGCSCDLNIFASTPKSPVIYIDRNVGQLQWSKISNYSKYSIYLNDNEIGSITATEDVVTYDISQYMSNQSYMSFTVKTKSDTGKASKASNAVILDYTPRTNTYTYSEALITTTSITDDGIISWQTEPFADTYLVTTYSNTTGLHEYKTTATSYNLANVAAPAHEIIAWNVGYLTSATDTEADLLSPRINYYNPDSYGTYTADIVVFDNKIYDHYITSKDELNTIMYYEFNDRSESYDVRFDADYVSGLGILNSDRRIKNDINDSFDSFYETKYVDFVYPGKELATAKKISTDEYTISMDFLGVYQCDITKDVNPSYTYGTADTGLEFYKTYDWNTNGRRFITYNDFASDKYFLTAEVESSDELFQAVEGRTTPIVTSGSRAEQIYSRAKSVLRQIISPNMTTYEKALSIFDWITYNTVYDYSGDYYSENYVFTQDCSYYLEGVFLKGVAVCDGFSKAYSLLCNMEGIDCIRISGDAKTSSGEGGHAWNKVIIDGNAYMVDITWTEILGKVDKTKKEYLSHKYFLVSETALAGSHFECDARVRFDQYVTPMTTDYNYFDHTTISYNNGTSVVSGDLTIDNSADLKRILDNQVYNDSDFIEFRININYLDSLITKYSSETYVDALQQEMRSVKFGAQLITQIYDILGTSLNFIEYLPNDTYLVTIFQTDLLADEMQELTDIIVTYRNLGRQDASWVNHPIDFNIAHSLFLSELDLADSDITSSNLDNILSQLAAKLGKNNCEYTLTYSGSFDEIVLNSDTNKTKIYKCILTITDVTYTPIAIPSPTIQLNGSIISWDAVANASSYIIYCNDSVLDTITTSQAAYSINLSSYTMPADTYSIHIIAKTNNSDYLDSADSNSITYIITTKGTLSAPIVSINYGSGLLSWDEIDGADNYAIYLDNTMLGGYVSATSYNILDYIINAAAGSHTIKVVSHSSDNSFYDSVFSNIITYQGSTGGYSSILGNNIYANSTLGATYSIADGLITWQLPTGVTDVFMAIYNDEVGYSWTDVDTNSISVSDIYSAHELDGDEILAVLIASKVGNKYFAANLDITYYNPTSHTEYAQVFAFDGILSDHYITSQAELNHFVYYSFIYRLTHYEIGIDPSLGDKENYGTMLKTAYNSFVETSYNSYTISYTQGYMEVDVTYIGGTECDLDIYQSNSISPTYYPQYSKTNAYYLTYDYTANGKLSASYTWACDNQMIRVPVSTSEELYKALEGGYTPVFEAGSRAATIYAKAKSTILSVISPAMSDYEMALTLFDWIANNTTYDYTAAYYLPSTISPISVPAFYLEGVFLKNLSVCDGYSKAYSLMCNMLGIECYRVSGTANTGSGTGGHAWNKIKVDGNYYLADLTWTEYRCKIDGTTYECMAHTYFLVTDEFVADTHFQHAEHTKYLEYTTPTNSYNAFDKTELQGDLSKISQDLLISTPAELNNLVDIAKSNKCTYLEFVIAKELLDTMIPAAASSTTPTSVQSTTIARKFAASNNTVYTLYSGNNKFYQYDHGCYGLHLIIEIEWN